MTTYPKPALNMVCHAFSEFPSMKKNAPPIIITLAIGKEIATIICINGSNTFASISSDVSATNPTGTISGIGTSVIFGGRSAVDCVSMFIAGSVADKAAEGSTYEVTGIVVVENVSLRLIKANGKDAIIGTAAAVIIVFLVAYSLKSVT